MVIGEKKANILPQINIWQNDFALCIIYSLFTLIEIYMNMLIEMLRRPRQTRM